MDKKEKQKGLTLATIELREEILKQINNSGLPIINIKYMLKEIYIEAEKLEAKQFEKEKEEFYYTEKEEIANKGK